MPDIKNILLTGLAPAIWGSTFWVTTQLLPDGYPLTNAFLRALPAGVLLLIFTQTLPKLAWVPYLLILGALNFAIFWWLLFVAAYRLPGGVAAAIGAIQPLIVFGLTGLLLGTKLRWQVYTAGLTGLIGVTLLVLRSEATLNMVGVLAAIGGAFSMALGVVLSKRWQFPVQPLTFASWQLIAGGALILPFALIFEPPLPKLTSGNVLGYVYLALIGGAVTYVLWFRGIVNLGPVAVTSLGFLSPVSAALLGWFFLSQSMTATQLLGLLLILGSVYAALAARPATPPPSGETGNKTSDGHLAAPASSELRNTETLLASYHDPLDHPAIARMSLRELADLPLPRRQTQKATQHQLSNQIHRPNS